MSEQNVFVGEATVQDLYEFLGNRTILEINVLFSPYGVSYWTFIGRDGAEKLWNALSYLEVRGHLPAIAAELRRMTAKGNE